MKDRLLSIKDLTNNTNIREFTYDSAHGGYPVSITKNGTKIDLVWEGKRLKKYGNINFFYNDEGIRIGKGSDDYYEEYILEGSKIVGLHHSAANGIDYTIYFNYDETGKLFGASCDGKEYFYIHDITGNITKIVDEDFSIVALYEYDAFGKLKPDSYHSQTTTIGKYNPFIYKNYFYDVETGLFYCNSRYYSPELCRWLTPDSIEYLDPESINGLNLYCYCGNNPVMYVDPSGHAPWWSWALSGLQLVAGVALCFVPGMQGLGVSLAIGGATGLIMNVLEPQLAQAIGGVGSMANGYGAISTGISLMSLGGWAAVAGLCLTAIGFGTMAFGANEVVDAMTGTNYIQKWTGMNDSAYVWSYLGLNFASSIGQAAGNVYRLHATREIRLNHSGTEVNGYRYFDRKGNPFFDFDYPHNNIPYNHWHGWDGPGLTNRTRGHWSYLRLILWMLGGM